MDDIVNLLMTGGFVLVTDVVSIQLAFGIVTFTNFVLTVVGIVVIVFYAPVKFVIRGVL